MVPVVFGVLAVLTNLENVQTVHHDYCVIGAGPGGLQIGYFLHKAKRDYVIFEKTNTPGSFFQKFPRHRTLVSINKKYNGQLNAKDNMRHDWNSLLTDNPDLKFDKYTEDFYPKADVLLKYLEDFTRIHNLKVQFNTSVGDINRHLGSGNHRFSMKDQNGKRYTCRALILATGLFVPLEPKTIGKELTLGYEEVSVNPKDFTGKKVLLIGRGNAAFEIADAILHEAHSIHMLSRSGENHVKSTNYVGNLRATDDNSLDNYQLKTLEGLMDTPMEHLTFERNPSGKIVINTGKSFAQVEEKVEYALRENLAFRSEYDVVVRCTGFKSQMSVFNQSSSPKVSFGGKYPALKASYESANIADLFVAGALGHSADYRKSAGGFIHGYRYTARTVYKIMESRYHRRIWDHVEYKIYDVINVLTKRFNETDSLYQMYRTLGDVILIDRFNGTFTYFEDFPIGVLANFEEITLAKIGSQAVLVLNYEYGDVKKFDTSNTTKPKSNFLHPVLYFYENLPTEEDMNINKEEESSLPRPNYLHHILEDLFTFPVPLTRFFERVLLTDMTTAILA